MSPKQSPLLVVIMVDFTVGNCLRVASIELLMRASSPIPAETTVRQNFKRAIPWVMEMVKSLPQFEFPWSLIGAINPLLFSLLLGPAISCWMANSATVLVVVVRHTGST